MSLPRYPNYKDSGVEWLGEVPEHWDVVRLRQLGPLLKGSGASKEDVVDEGVPCVRYGDLYTTHSFFIRAARTCVTEERSADYTPIQQGDVLFAASGEKMAEIGKSAVNLMPTTAYCGGDIILLRPTDVGELDVPFLGYACDCHASSVQKASMGRGTTIKHIYPDELKRLVLTIPPRAEQTGIAAFLDSETSKIDALVAEQERLIELLKEKRQAVISHAVTKGLNPDARMKDSGIEWLGEVPAHWRVIALKRIASVNTGVAKGKDNTSRATITVPYLRVANVQDGYLSLDSVAEIEIGASELERYALKPGDVLMNEGGDFDKLGRGCVWNGEIDPCITQNHVFAVRPSGVASEWLNAITSSEYAQFYFMARSKQSTNLASISSTNLMELPVVLPPAEEQAAILAHIAIQTTRFDELTSEAQRGIELLQERRTALISAAVTGQIDVRPAAARRSV